MVGTTIKFDALLEVCRDPHRNIVLSELVTEKQTVTVDELATAIADYTHHTPLTALPEEEFTQLKIALVHNHLPRLEAHSLVEYDQERQRVEPTARLERVAPELTEVIRVSAEV